MKKILIIMCVMFGVATAGATPVGYGGGAGVVIGNPGGSINWNTYIAPVVRILTGTVQGASTTASTTLVTTVLQRTTPRIFTVNLRVGIRNTEVQFLQEELIEDSYLAPGNNSGFFGPRTLQAVRNFQRDHGLPQTGFVGPLTRNALNNN